MSAGPELPLPGMVIVSPLKNETTAPCAAPVRLQISAPKMMSRNVLAILSISLIVSFGIQALTLASVYG